jgi:acetyl esterase/lipase
MAATPRLEEWMRLSKERLRDTDIMHQYILDLYEFPPNFSPPQDLGHDIFIERVDIHHWPLYRISTRSSLGAMLYCHGGDFVNEIVSQHYQLAAQIAREAEISVLIPIYPLLPRPTARFEQVVSGLCEIVAIHHFNVISIAGDSAGGTLAMLTMQRLIRTQSPGASRIKSLILIPPLLDCSLSHRETINLEPDDPWLGIDGLHLAARLFNRDPVTLIPWIERADPNVSPLFGNIADLPATLLLSGTRDLLCADARRLSARFRNGDTSENAEECIAGSVELEGFKYVEAEDMLHVWPLMASLEGAEAREVIMDFLRKHKRVPRMLQEQKVQDQATGTGR